MLFVTAFTLVGCLDDDFTTPIDPNLESKTYTLEERDVDGISGSATFEERLNGLALATVLLCGTQDGGSHPTHIQMNTAAEGDSTTFTGLYITPCMPE